MKLFFDTEFTGLHANTTLISIGIISEDGRTFYAELTDYDKDQIDDGLQENVISNLKLLKKDRHSEIDSSSMEVACNKEELNLQLRKWLKQFDNIEIWSDCLA